MPRPREFDPEDLLEKAMLAFLENGLQRTTMRYLEAATGVKQVSLYNAYGSKEGLFLAAFDRYARLATEIQERYLEGNGLEGIVEYAKAVASPDSPMPQAHSGCMVVNTALLAETGGSAVRERVQRFRADMKARLVAAFDRAKRNGEMRSDLNLDSCAEFVISIIWGNYVNIRLMGSDPQIGAPAARMLEITLREWALPRSA